MKYKAIISDLDGTLIQQGKTGSMKGLPSKRVTSAVEKIKNIMHFGIATSRPLSYTSHVFDHLALSGPCIIHGGSILIDPQSKQVLWEKNLEIPATKAVMEIVKKYKTGFVIHERSQEIIRDIWSYTPQHPINIFLFDLTKEKLEEVHQELKKIPTIAMHKVPSFTPGLWGFDITHIEATKQHGIMQVAEILNIYPSEIIGIGDGYNDFPLLLSCGLKVAMGNAVEELKAIADYIAPSVDEDGVADVIEKFIHF